MLKKILYKNGKYSRIGLRLSLYAVILSIFFAFISLTILIYIESEQEKELLVQNTQQAIITIEHQLAKDLWDLDSEGIRLTLKSLTNLSFISGASLTCHIDKDITEGEFSPPEDIKHPIVFNSEELGVLRVTFNNDSITQGLYEKYKMMGLIILSIMGLMSFIFYIMVDHSLIKHIAYISNTRKTTFLNNTQEYIPLSLVRKPRNDELNDLIDVLNEGKRTAVELLQARKEYQDQMEYQANFDLLTGLPNRRHLYSYLNQQIQEYREDLGQLVIMFVDLDGFKQVNDSMGHSIGDKVLKDCATRIKQVSKEFDGYASRLGGDEFIICFYRKEGGDIDLEPKRVISIFDEKINTDGINVKLGCSIGVTTYPDHYFDDPKLLIRNADSALYKAKDLGRNTFFYFNDEIRKELIFERKVKDKVIEAIENNRFTIYYQPLIDIQVNHVVGFEALLRWKDKELGAIPPDVFIPIAEKMGVIFDIDTWVFKNATKQVRIWRELFDEPFILSVNFSPTNFYHGNFNQWVSQDHYLKSNELDWIELEVTERLVLNNDPIVLDGIALLKNSGIRFSIDDFGIGYSSLGYIKNFSHALSKIKIDRIFIDEILFSDFDIAFIKSIMMLSNSLGLTILAEGVEEKRQVDLLRKLGCKYAQGYYYSKALPEKETVMFIESWLAGNLQNPLNHCKNNYI